MERFAVKRMGATTFRADGQPRMKLDLGKQPLSAISRPYGA
jgi:hypothetical protein